MRLILVTSANATKREHRSLPEHEICELRGDFVVVCIQLNRVSSRSGKTMSTELRKLLPLVKCPQMESFRIQVLERYGDMSIQEVASAISSHTPTTSLSQLHTEMRDHVANCPVCIRTQAVRSSEGGNKNRNKKGK